MPHTYLPLDCHCNSGVHGQYRRGMNGFTPWQFTRRDTSVLLSPFSIPACQHAAEGVFCWCNSEHEILVNCNQSH